MVHLYENKPDGRQMTEGSTEKVSRFRPRYRELRVEEKDLHDLIKEKATELEALFESVPDGRYKSLGMTALEESVMWAVKQLTA